MTMQVIVMPFVVWSKLVPAGWLINHVNSIYFVYNGDAWNANKAMINSKTEWNTGVHVCITDKLGVQDKKIKKSVKLLWCRKLLETSHEHYVLY